MLDTKPAIIAERLRAAGAELSAQESVVAEYHDSCLRLVAEVGAELSQRTDHIAERLHSSFIEQLTIVEAAADAGLLPFSTAADVLTADDAVLSAAFRSLPAAAARLDGIDALLIDVHDMVGVTIAASGWPPYDRGLVSMQRADGGYRWVPDPRCGRRWLAYVLDQRAAAVDGDPPAA